MFGHAKPLASLSGGLLARKGGARPAMRPQGYASLAPTSQQLEDLGWDDMGHEPQHQHQAPPQLSAVPAAEVEKPPVLVAREALAQVIEAPEAPVEAPRAVRPVSVATATRLSRETAHKGRAAFTLRLDAERHLRLRLASALAHQSAQQLVAHALDQFLDTMPEVDALAAQLPPQKLTRSKGKRT
jgi:hypothetical protein